ncbi:hypothetical protein CGGC5_v017088 [Colletotrichum fructicola Nara gc5]|uniref:Uncharacterized protein n=1 Tax=Colletotrichum fructicola (strain Nara gc5) TaxID=1213859 RepID=A0A7J6IDC8_COLFN|nr:hypothetical protein CGGC5_v017088 [Colletotrichum fructicola Nara gc5]
MSANSLMPGSAAPGADVSQSFCSPSSASSQTTLGQRRHPRDSRNDEASLTGTRSACRHLTKSALRFYRFESVRPRIRDKIFLKTSQDFCHYQFLPLPKFGLCWREGAKGRRTVLRKPDSGVATGRAPAAIAAVHDICS